SEPGAGTKGRKHQGAGQVTAYNPQPVSPELYGRSPAAFKRCKSSGDDDLISSGMFVVRIAPIRPGGTPATDEERPRTAKVGSAVARFFTARGMFPIPLDCGNWLELLLPTVPYADIPWTTEQGHALAKMLAREYATDDVMVSAVPP